MQQLSSGNEEILETSVNQMSLKFRTDKRVMGFVGLCFDPRGKDAMKTHPVTGGIYRKTITFLPRECLPGTSIFLVEPQELWSQFELQTVERKQEL